MTRTRTGSDPSRCARLRWLLIPGSAVLLALLLNTFVMVFAHVPSGSMESTIPAGSLVIGSRLSYRDAPPQRGDIIFFRHEETGNTLLIKRVVAVAGDTFQIKSGTVYINGAPEQASYATGAAGKDTDAVTVPEGKLLVLGDNREASRDSRYWEDPFVDQQDVVGQAAYLLLPALKKL